jgi:ATP-binding cassette subfamily C protein
VARLTRQVEIVRDSFAGLVLVIRSFAVTVVGVVSGLLSLEPVIAALVVPLFLLGLAAARVRTSLRADEDSASTAGSVFAGQSGGDRRPDIVRDITAGGSVDFASDLVSEPIEAHAAAERALARGGCPADRVLRLGRLAATADPGRLRTLAGGPRCNHRNVAWRAASPTF